MRKSLKEINKWSKASQLAEQFAFEVAKVTGNGGWQQVRLICWVNEKKGLINQIQIYEAGEKKMEALFDNSPEINNLNER